MKEFVIWARPKGTDAMHERPSYTAKSRDEANWAIDQFRKKGFDARVQVIDGTLPDFVGAINI